MSKMNGKKEMLEKKGAVNEIKENEMENVSGGVQKIGNKWVTHGMKGELKWKPETVNKLNAVDMLIYDFDNKADALKKEKDLENRGYTVF